MKLVKPQHFLPVHGEYSFLCAHAQLARSHLLPSLLPALSPFSLSHTHHASPDHAACHRLQLL